MPQHPIARLAEFGQSIWLDYIHRDLIESGDLADWVRRGLKGMTSNPAIFNQVISEGSAYDASMARLSEQGLSVQDVYDALTIKDIQDAADCFRPVYESTGAFDGYVSLEINPKLSGEIQASVEEGLRLFQRVNRPNVMIKVPATGAGFPVVSALLGEGVNVNVTLIFSLDQYIKAVEAYREGILRALEKELPLSRIRSVASVFVSRIDTRIDGLLDQKVKAAHTEAERSVLSSLKGRVAGANCRMIYDKYKEYFCNSPAAQLKQAGAQAQRVLWASTSTKNPAYSDVKYVEELVAKETVNTVPAKTLQAYCDHGRMTHDLALDTGEAETVLKVLWQTGIRLDDECRLLLHDGVQSFEKAFEQLFRSIEDKLSRMCSQS